MAVAVKLTHRTKLYDMTLDAKGTIADVRKKACELTGLKPDRYRILARGRNMPDSAALSSLISGKVIKLVIAEKAAPKRPAPEANAQISNTPRGRVDAACKQLASCVQKVQMLPNFNFKIISLEVAFDPLALACDSLLVTSGGLCGSRSTGHLAQGYPGTYNPTHW